MLRTMTLLLAAVLLAACAAAPPEGNEAGRRPPNVVIVFADDLGWGDVGVHGAKGIRTPHIDRLASEGVRFTDFYVSQAVCSASRTSLLTGCYPQRVGIQGALGPGSKIGIADAETTLAEPLRARGYATAAFGKWHLGDDPTFLPRRHGFDEYFGLPYSNDMWPFHPERPGGYPDLPLIDGETVVATNPDQSTLSGAYTDRAIAFIERNRARPFLLYLPHSMPHVPIHASARFRGKSAAGLYGDVIEEIDDSVGRILAAIREHGLDRDTLVIFTSDNGPWLSYGDHAGSAGPLREGKGTSFEGGVRVPFLARWPGRIPAGAVVRTPAMTIDLLPTICGLAGAALPGLPIDGRDIAPLLRAEPGAASPHEAYFFWWGRELQAVRSGRWKLHFPHEYRSLDGKPGGTGGTPATYVTRTIGRSLFDLEADPGETADVSAAHPDVVARLEALAAKARHELGDSLTDRPGTGVRKPGRR